MDKVLLTDVDGVLLDWETAFDNYAKEQGYTFKPGWETVYSIGEQLGIGQEEGTRLINNFNHSAGFEFLTPYRDSVEGVKRFKDNGWYIIAITTAGEHPDTYPMRKRNLDAVFGPGAINELYVLPLHGDKGVQLKNYRNLYWIEDKPSNAELGLKYGLYPMLMDNKHNKNYKGVVPRVNTWEEIYRIING